ncbi:MAG: DOMON-like domain-containing protein [Desulfobacteraceae bacterium]|nr:DOMON-like domain-containing protein [Desulfobacteraceae bacterium]
MSTCELVPFPGGDHPSVRLEAILRREGDSLLLCYLVRGALDRVALPERAERPERRDGLWRQTCFELFFGPMGGKGYHEVNLSPAGHWNLYTFDDYRAGMRPEATVGSLAFTVARDTESLAVVLELALASLYPPGTALRAGLATVIADRAGHPSYWALAHAGDRPDFHHRGNFLVTIR